MTTRPERNQDATVYVGNLANEVEEDVLYELMVQVGPVSHVKLPKDKIHKTHLGFAFIEFKTPRDAEYVIKVMNGVALYGRNLKVNKANRNGGGGAGSSGMNEDMNSIGAQGAHAGATAQALVDVGANLYIGNLDPLIDENFLQATFSHFGQFVKPPLLVRDPISRDSKGYGFLYFDNFDTSDKVLQEMNNAYLMNKPVKIEYALKENGKHGERHGDDVERLLAKNAILNNVIKGSNNNTPEPLSQEQQQQEQAETLEQNEQESARPSLPPSNTTREEIHNDPYNDHRTRAHGNQPWRRNDNSGPNNRGRDTGRGGGRGGRGGYRRNGTGGGYAPY